MCSVFLFMVDCLQQENLTMPHHHACGSDKHSIVLHTWRFIIVWTLDSLHKLQSYMEQHVNETTMRYICRDRHEEAEVKSLNSDSCVGLWQGMIIIRERFSTTPLQLMDLSTYIYFIALFLPNVVKHC